ncbi:MAG TPA: hypothetical protein VGC95_05630, partial [Chitinophagaceae bacterium]
PALQSIMSGNVPRNEQGELQGALTSIMCLTSVFGPILMNNLFAWFTKPSAPVYFPGISFLLGALLILASIGVAYKTLQKGEHLGALRPEETKAA